MLRFADSDQELAFVVAHEMAHNILGHADEDSGSRGLFAELGFGAKRIKVSEMEADAFAVELLAGAGYDLTAPESFLRHSAKLRRWDLATTHPGTSRRIAIVNAAAKKVADERLREAHLGDAGVPPPSETATGTDHAALANAKI